MTIEREKREKIKGRGRTKRQRVIENWQWIQSDSARFVYHIDVCLWLDIDLIERSIKLKAVDASTVVDSMEHVYLLDHGSRLCIYLTLACLHPLSLLCIQINICTNSYCLPMNWPDWPNFCMFSPTWTLVSKYLDTHLSKQRASCLLTSPSA